MATNIETIERILMEQLTDLESEVEEEPTQEPTQEPETISEPYQNLSLELPQEDTILENTVPPDITTTTEQETTKIKLSFFCCF